MFYITKLVSHLCQIKSNFYAELAKKALTPAGEQLAHEIASEIERHIDLCFEVLLDPEIYPEALLELLTDNINSCLECHSQYRPASWTEVFEEKTTPSTNIIFQIPAKIRNGIEPYLTPRLTDNIDFHKCVLSELRKDLSRKEVKAIIETAKKRYASVEKKATLLTQRKPIPTGPVEEIKPTPAPFKLKNRRSSLHPSLFQPFLIDGLPSDPGPQSPEMDEPAKDKSLCFSFCGLKLC
jgi:hypothetical protein